MSISISTNENIHNIAHQSISTTELFHNTKNKEIELENLPGISASVTNSERKHLSHVQAEMNSASKKIKYEGLNHNYSPDEDLNIGFDTQHFNIKGIFNENDHYTLKDYFTGKITIRNYIRSFMNKETLNVIAYGLQYFGTLIMIILLTLHLFSFNYNPDTSILSAFVQNSRAIPISTLVISKMYDCPEYHIPMPIGFYINQQEKVQNLYNWNNFNFCYQNNWDFLRSTSCPDGYISCSTGWCYPNTTGCPIVSINYEVTQGESNYKINRQAGENPIYNITTSYGMLPCLDPSIIPTPNNQGCGKFGSYPDAQIIDTNSYANFTASLTNQNDLNHISNNITVNLVGLKIFSLKNDSNGFCAQFDRDLVNYSDLFDLKVGLITYGFLILSLVTIYGTYVLSVIASCYFYRVPVSTKFLLMEKDYFYFYPALQFIFLVFLNVISYFYYSKYQEEIGYLSKGVTQGCYMQKEVNFALESIVKIIEVFCENIIRDIYILAIINGFVALFFLISNRSQLFRADVHEKLDEESEDY